MIICAKCTDLKIQRSFAHVIDGFQTSKVNSDWVDHRWRLVVELERG